MPLNISIDVDGTILDENENLIPQVRESIQRLKDAGHYVQLWSGGGAEYAEKIARKFNLTHLIDSYAKKADVAIDDLPETAHPATVIHVDQQHRLEQAVQKVFQTEQNIDSAITLSPKMLRYIEQLQAEKPTILENYKAILRLRDERLNREIPLHPIPFFGVIENARVITVGLNPSTTEFTEVGRWSNILTPFELTQRLVRYFRLPETPPHYWFADLQWSLEILRCPYHFAAAHVDASPWTTYGPRHLAEHVPNGCHLYDQLLAAGIQNCLPRTIEFCKDTVKLVIICSSNPQTIAQAIRHLLGPNWSGEIVIKPKSEIPRWAWENREKLIKLLDLENVFH